MKFRHVPIGLVYKKDNIREEPEEELGDLEASIERFDLIQPILVRPVNGRYEIVSGHRRFLAMKLRGEVTIPCVIRDDITDADRIYIQLSENTQRKQMSAAELVDTFNRLKAENPGLTNAQIGARIGRSEHWVRNQYIALKLAGNLEDRDTAGLTAGQIIGRAQRQGVASVKGTSRDAIRVTKVNSTTLTVRCIDSPTRDYVGDLLRQANYRIERAAKKAAAR